jgi:hypothetical protein
MPFLRMRRYEPPNEQWQRQDRKQPGIRELIHRANDESESRVQNLRNETGGV